MQRATIAVTIAPAGQNMPAGKLAEAEISFADGPLVGLKLIGFAVWESRYGDRRNVTFPARQYAVNGERRSFALLRPADGNLESQDRLRRLILDAFTRARETAGRTETSTWTYDQDGDHYDTAARCTAHSRIDCQACSPAPAPAPVPPVLASLVADLAAGKTPSLDAIIAARDTQPAGWSSIDTSTDDDDLGRRPALENPAPARVLESAAQAIQANPQLDAPTVIASALVIPRRTPPADVAPPPAPKAPRRSRF